MLTFIKQNGLTIISILVSAFLSIYIYLKSKKKKQLAYDVEFQRPVVEKLTNDIKIFYKDNTEITETLKMISIRFINNGNEPIKRDDFESDIILRFKKEDDFVPTVYEISSYETSPSYLDIQTFNEDFGKLTGIKPLLLNPKDEFTINVLMTNYKGLEVSTRIVGGSTEIYRENQKRFFRILEKSFTGVAVIMIILYPIALIYKFFFK
ncbi:hypothetical protein [Neobacillus mesonae]|uniref:hypothetical protein n=1 Tax=Neobacillus mesonae TaxID=1193713 RepID=UPI00082B182A|nr:hypothetical protein [Neobacillus mesonae]